MDNKEVKKAITKIMASKEYKEEKKRAVDWSHKFIEGLDDDGKLSPLLITLFVSHIMTHVLIAAPEKRRIYEMLGIFLADLDLPELVKAWEKRQDEDEDEDDEHPTIH